MQFLLPMGQMICVEIAKELQLQDKKELMSNMHLKLLLLVLNFVNASITIRRSSTITIGVDVAGGVGIDGG